MVVLTYKDGFVQLYLNSQLKLEQAAIDSVTIGTYSGFKDGEETEIKDYDLALVGKDAALSNIEVMVDGVIFVDEGGKVSNINITGGTLSGSPVCENATGWYGAAICLSSSDYTQSGSGLVSLTGGTFSNCSVNPLSGYTGHGGAIETYGGTFSAKDSFFTGNSANGTSAAGGALALMFSTNTVTGGTFSGNTAYFGGAIQQNSGSMTVTGTLFAGNSTSGAATADFPTENGGGAIELHNGAAAVISGSTFSENASRSGGAIFNDTFDGKISDATISGSTFSGNTADYQGGAIYNYASMSISGSDFSDNTVTDPDPFSYTSFGGAIANTQCGTLTVTGGTFTGNNAVQGGAIATFISFGSTDTASLTVKDASFSGNSGTYGGGIYIQTGATDKTEVSGSDFSGNTASWGGGAICQCFGPMSVSGGKFTSNSAGNDGGAIAVWDSGTATATISGADFTENYASYGGAVSHSYASASLTISNCTFTGNGVAAAVPDDASAEPGDDEAAVQEPVTSAQGGAIWNNYNAYGTNGVVTVLDCTFSGNKAKQGGAVYNEGFMRLENIALVTESDTVYNGGSLAFAGVNKLGAEVVNDGDITFSVSGGAAVVDDLGKFGGTGSYLVKLKDGAITAGAEIAASAGTFTGSLSVKLGDVASPDEFTFADGVIGDDVAVAGDAVLRLKASEGGALTVTQETLQNLVPAVLKDGSVLVWSDETAAGAGYWIEITDGSSFDSAIRIATDGNSFDVSACAGEFSCRAARENGDFTADSAAWSNTGSAPRQVEAAGAGRSDIFFASVDGNDVWTSIYRAWNAVTGEIAVITGKNRIRDTFSGSSSDANILYLSDRGNGDVLFMDDIFSEFGEAARLSLIREVRAGAGDDVVDMTSDRYAAELAGMAVRGGAGDDVIWGASGGNSLFGDAGNDRISGGTGDDLIAGGAGDDILQGGGGADLFTFGENWGADIVSQAEGGTVELWFLEAAGQISHVEDDNGVVFSNAAGTSTVTVKNMAFADLAVHYGDDGSAQFAALMANGAFLGSTSEAVFETASARQNGILASL